MDLQDPKVQRILLAAVLSAVALYLFFGTTLMQFTYPSRGAQIAELEQEHEKLSRDLERARLTVRNMPKLEREFEYLHKQWRVAQSLLPEHNEISTLLRKIAASGTQAGLEFVQFEPKPSLAHGFYTENPIYVEVEGSYHQMGSFLSLLSNLNRIINVRSLSVAGVEPQTQGDPEVTHTLEASMEIVAYSIDKGATIDTMTPDMTGNGQGISSSSQSSNSASTQAAVAEGSH